MELKGVNRDMPLEHIPEQSWIYARNIVIGKDYKSIKNEKGFVQDIDIDYDIIGIISCPSEYVVFSSNNTNLEIGVVRSGSYSKIIRTQHIPSSSSNPIFGVYRYDYNGNLIVVWSDNSDVPRILNLDNLPFSVDEDYELVNSEQVLLTKLYPDFKIPDIDLNSVDEGGSILSGVHYFTMQYEIEDNIYSDWITISQPVTITDSGKSEGFYQYDGCEAGTVTSKSITMSIANIDTRYNKYRIGVISKVNNQLSQKIIGTYEISNENLFTYSGNENEGELSLEEIFVNNQTYSKVGTMCTIRNSLVIGNLEEEEELKYQKYANNIEITYVADDFANLDDVGASYKDEMFIYNKRGFMPGEVYAFYVRFGLKNGKYSKAFHIPGREANTGDKNDTGVSVGTDIYTDAKKFHFENTAVTTGNQMGYWENSDEQYPNDDEFDGTEDYDGNAISGGRDLRGTNVKHHKFPTVNFMESNSLDYVKDASSSGATNNRKVKLETPETPSPYVSNEWERLLSFTNKTSNATDLLKVETYGTKQKYCKIIALEDGVDVNLDYYLGGTFWGLTSGSIEDPDGIEVTVEIGKYDDSTGTSSVIDTDTVVLQAEISDDSESVSLDKDDYIYINCYTDRVDGTIVDADGDFYGNVTITVDDEAGADATIKGRILGIKASNIAIPDYLKGEVEFAEILYAKRNLSNSLVAAQSEYFSTGSDNARIYPFDLMTAKPGLSIDYMTSEVRVSSQIMTHTTQTTVSAGDFVNQITKARYLPFDNTSTNPSNENYQDCIYIETDSNLSATLTLATFYSFKSNCYKGFQSQQLVSTGYRKRISIQDSVDMEYVYGGDTFCNLHGITRSAGSENNVTYYLYCCYSVSNIGLRHTTDDLESTYYPQYNVIDDTEGKGTTYDDTPDETDSLWTDIEDAGGYTNFQEWQQQWNYNSDYSSVNDLTYSEIFNYLVVDNNEFPYRVAKSTVQADESLSNGWRRFLPLEYRECSREKGEITNVIADGNDLLVSHEYALFVLPFNKNLELDNQTIALGNPTIFSPEQVEIMPDGSGYVGNSSKFVPKLTKVGIVFVDIERGKIFLYSNKKVDEISKYGLKEYFSNNLNGPYDDSFVNNTISVSWDDSNDRLVFCNKNYNDETVPAIDNSFYMSYYPIVKYWAGWHDYDCNYTFNNRDGLYFVNGDKVYYHSTDTSGQYGTYTGDNKESIIDIVFNDPKYIEKQLESILIRNLVISNGVYDYDKTLTKIIIYTYNKHSDLQTLTPYTFNSGNIRNTGGTWKYNNFRNVLNDSNYQLIDLDEIDPLVVETLPGAKVFSNWYDKQQMIDNFFVVRLIYDNEDDDEITITNVSIHKRDKNR